MAAAGGEDRDRLDEGTSHVLDIDTPLLRQVGRDALSLALIDARNCTLRRFEAFERAGMLQVPCLPELDPPLWELGHVAWFQEYWVGRNIERYLQDHPVAVRYRRQAGACAAGAGRRHGLARGAGSRRALPRRPAGWCVHPAPRTSASR